MNFKMCVVSVVVLAGGVANAGMLQKPNGNWPGGNQYANAGNNVWVRSYAPSLANANDAPGFSAALQRQNFRQDAEGTGVLSGSFTLDQNTAWATNEPAQHFYGYTGGAFDAANRPNTLGNAFALSYTPAGNDPLRENARWLQVIRTNDPLAWGRANGTAIPGDNGFTWYIDNGWPGSTPGTDPFYGADDNLNNTGYAANGRGLIDSPSRAFQTGIIWEAWAFISTRDSSGNLTVYDGVHWGFETSAVPTPGSLALLGVGSLLAFRRKR